MASTHEYIHKPTSLILLLQGEALAVRFHKGSWSQTVNMDIRDTMLAYTIYKILSFLQ